MSSIPGVSIEKKLAIQHKIDKIINQEFLSPCPHFLDKVSSFNHRLYNSLSSEITCKRNAKISSNFHFSRGTPPTSFSYITEVKMYLNNPNYLLNLLIKTFPIDELIILLNHIDIFIKNEYVRKYFPKIKKESIEDIFDKNIINENKQTSTLPIIFPYDTKNEIKIDAKKEVTKKVDFLFNREKAKLDNFAREQIENKKKLKKILNSMDLKINNITKIANENNKHHPLVEYYINKNKKNMKRNKSSFDVFRSPDTEKYMYKFQENKAELEYMKKLKAILMKSRKERVFNNIINNG